jgi:hypothetical protein
MLAKETSQTKKYNIKSVGCFGTMMEDTMTKDCDYIVHWVAIKGFFFFFKFFK